jgi:HNH endonuclease
VFTQAHSGGKPVPWGQIAIGEPVWMKWTGGPVVPKATVSGFRQLQDCTPAALRNAVMGFALHDLEAYWSALASRLNGIVIYLTGETWLDQPVTLTGQRSRGASWIVFADRAGRERWMATPSVTATVAKSDPRGSRTAGPALRFAVFRRDSYTCQYCGRRAPTVVLHVDHIVAWSRGGQTDLSNLRTACNVCNAGKGDADA